MFNGIFAKDRTAEELGYIVSYHNFDDSNQFVNMYFEVKVRKGYVRL